MYGVLDKTMHHAPSWSWERLAVIWGSCMIDPFLSTANGNCAMRKFLRKKASLGYIFAEEHL